VFSILVQNALFIVSRSTAALSCRNLASAGTSVDCSPTQRQDK